MTTQGSSSLTPRKELELGGLAAMRFTQFKSKFFKFKNVICADVFCGSGVNYLYDHQVDGSPIKLLQSAMKAGNRNIDLHFWFSDIRKRACDSLRDNVDNNFNALSRSVSINAYDAKDAVMVLYETLSRRGDTYLFLVLDPNGPGCFPKREIDALIRTFHKRVDIIPYISATAINRIIGAKNKAGIEFKGWLSDIENFDHGFISGLVRNGREGFIRLPIKSDKQKWTMIPTFGCFTPRNDWKKQGYVYIDSEEGIEAIKHYCGSTI
jgi:hypothetical protein